MPRLGGEDLAARVAERRPGLPVLFMSGYGQDRLAADHVLDPSIRLLAKPFGIDELLAAVREALGRPSES
jgi:DNA-binding NtrC family response regulator